MKTAGFVIWVTLLLVTVTLVGCSSSDSLEKQFASTSLGNSESKEVVTACQEALHKFFTRVEFEPETTTFTIGPKNYVDYVLGQPKRFRLNPKLRLEEKGRQWWVYLQVRVERQDSQTYQMFSQQSSASDRPYASNASDQSASYAKKQVWNFVRRDREMEKEILHEIRENLGLPASVLAAPVSNPQ